MKTLAEVTNSRNTMLTTYIAFLLLVLVLSPVSLFGQTNSLVLVGDMHTDRLIDHDLTWLQTYHPDDYRQVTETYAPITAANHDDFVSELLAVTNATGARGVLQLGDLQEGLAGNTTLATQMATYSTTSLRSTDFGCPWILTKGNHDITGPGATEAYQGVVIPFIASELGQSVTTTYFSYRTGDIEVIAIDCYDLGTMMTFLQQRLAASTAKYKIVATHMPVIPVTGRLWNIYQTDSLQREQLMNLIASYKAIVICGHLHHYSVVRRSTASGPLVQIMVTSVIRDRTRHTPYWASTDYGPSLVDHESTFDPSSATQRKQYLTAESKYITDFRVADMPGYAVLSFDDTVAGPMLKVYGGLGQAQYEEVSLKAYALNVDTVGAGTVTQSPSGNSFLAGAKVVLSAQPDPGYRFTGWSGALTGTQNPDTLTVQSDCQVTANFEALPYGQYELRTSVNGNGTVDLNPPGNYYMAGTQVTLYGRPSPGNVFVSWSGDVTGTVDSVSVTMDANKIVTASFRSLFIYPLGVRLDGQGSVNVQPSGGSYVEGSSVTVEAQPAEGWEFAGWTGALSGTTNPATVVMACPQEVKALFHKTGSKRWALTPVKDGYVRGSLYAGNNFGTDTTLRVQESGSDLTRLRSYLQFGLDTVRQAGGTLLGARLLLKATPGGIAPEGSAGASVYACEALSDTWTETGLTWKTAPAEGTVADSTTAMNYSGNLYSWDVTQAVAKELADDGVLSLLMKDRAARNLLVNFHSRESVLASADPVLEVETTGGTDAVLLPERNGGALPTRFALQQNFPNPFNPSTEISYSLARDSQVRLAVYDMVGRQVALLLDGRQSWGNYHLRWNGVDAEGRTLPSGCYLLRMTTPQSVYHIKMMLVK